MSSDGASPESAGTGRRSGWTNARWAAAAALLTGLIVLATVSQLTPHLRVCDDLIARVGTVPAVRSCRPLEMSDTSIVLMLILIVGLIAPDFRRISIGGVVELEREVREQESRIEGLATKIEMLTITAASARASVTFGQSLPQGVDITVSDETLEEKRRRLEDLDESSED